MRILITTQDKENWLLAPFFHFLAKNWPDCPFPIDILGGPKARETFLGLVDEGKKDSLWLREAYCGDDASWVKLLIWHLQSQNPNEPFLLLLNDYLLADKIDSPRIESYFTIMQNDPGVNFLRLLACPGPTGPKYGWLPEERALGIFQKGADYYISLQPTIFRTRFLLELLGPGWGIWDVELRGTQKACGIGGIGIGTYDSAFPVTNLLRRGQVEPNAKKWMEENW